jgi:hypothetical protein
MASEVQIQANQRNSELSNDFTTAADRARSAQKALKHGLSSRRLWMLKPEEHDLLDLAEELWACHAPVGAQEEALVKLMIYDLLTIDRLQRIETSVLSPPKLKSARLAPNGKEQTRSADTTIDIIMFSRRLAKVPLEIADRMRVYSAWGRGTQAAARVLDEIEGKGAQASDEAGDPSNSSSNCRPKMAPKLQSKAFDRPAIPRSYCNQLYQPKASSELQPNALGRPRTGAPRPTDASRHGSSRR